MAGYPQLATLLARFPEYQMFRKFDRLSALTLLYQQAELVNLEQELKVFAGLDDKNESTRDIGKCWESMKAAFQEGKALMQRDKINEIEHKLKTYHELLLRMTKVHHLSKPSNLNHKFLNEWLSSSQGGDNFLDIFEATPWQAESKPDLVCLNQESDTIDQYLARYLIPLWHLFRQRGKADTDLELGIGQMWEYKQSSFVVFGNICCMLLSSIVPLTSVFALFFATNNVHRLLLIAIFTIIFTGILGLATACRRSEVFAATAAFVAVQVVFLQGVIGIHQNDQSG